MKDNNRTHSSAPAGKDTLLNAVVWIVNKHGKSVSQDVLHAGLPRGEKLTPDFAVRMLEQVGIHAGWMKRDLLSVADSLFPVIIATATGEYAILLGRDGEHFSLLEPTEVEVRHLTGKELTECYAGFALFSKTRVTRTARADDDILPDASQAGHWLFSNLWRYRQYFYSAALAALLANILTLSTTFFTMNVYDRVVPTGAYATLWSLAIGVLIAISFEFISRQIRTYLVDSAGKKADLLVGSRLFRKTLAIRMECKPRSAGSFANQLREFESVRDFLSSATLATLSDLPFCLLFLSVMFMIGGQLVIIPMLAVPVIIIAGIVIQWPLSRYMKENISEISQKQGLVIETIVGLETLKAAKGEGVMQKRWDDFSALAAASSMKTRYLSSLTSNFVSYVQQVCTVLIVLWGVYLIHAGELTMGALVGMVILSGRSLSPLAAVVNLAIRFQQAKTALTSLNQLMAMPTERDKQAHFLPTPPLKGEIKLNQAGFHYPKTGIQDPQHILHDLNLQIRPGERVAILGSIGSGKSTLLKILARLYLPTQGQMTMDGLDVNQIDPADWRSACGYVCQDNRLFQGTLRHNIVIGNPAVSTERFLEVARLTGIDALSRRHPAGYDMPIGEMGQGLSGGQRQQVSLARCLLLDPTILLMDEPTSSMDTASEALFIGQLKKVVQDKTLVIVTHRTAVLELVDRIIVLEDGKILADGAKDVIMAKLRQSPRKATAEQNVVRSASGVAGNQEAAANA
ncbi:type I secretion system permease/ATPase [Mixta mediterraneensis]|uniref:type I secretion system permease/ATPase n=1 Tax=Mixta mediterraneensis TaxID=2758443 RepID=UPI001874C61F|nr:type I secretion system permease/ATPase [Mixta mediterraneensis]MBE5254212.1 type I secretion system permease/ATPase [Mixta mediterraneensis]